MIRKHGSMRTTAVFASALMIAAASASVASAHPSHEQSASYEADQESEKPDYSNLLTQEEALEHDATAIAKKEGIEVDAAKDRLALQFAVDDLVDSLPQSVIEASYAQHRMNHSEASPGAIIYFKGDVPAEAQLLVQKANASGIELRGGMEYSWLEMVARQNALHDAALKLGFTDISTQFDVATQRLTLEVALQVQRSDLTGTELRDAVVAELASLPASERVALAADELEIIEYDPGTGMVELQHGYGGASLFSGSQFYCTSAFVVRRSSDWLEGVLTAAHCEGINQIAQNNTSGGVDFTFSAPWKAEHIGNYGEIEWHSTTHDDFPQFWSGNAFRRTVIGRISNAAIGEGDYVCHYGRNDSPYRYDCGNVTIVNSSKTFPWNGQNVTAYNLTDVGNGVTCYGGDSGGPWFNINTAWGVHQGIRPQTSDCIFSKIQNAETAFGVFVQTG